MKAGKEKKKTPTQQTLEAAVSIIKAKTQQTSTSSS